MPLDTVVSADRASPVAVREAAVVRFAGDSGDGMQLTGSQFTLSTALAGNALATFPDFPAEIRAPQGTTFGVSAFQINFGSTSIETAGDEPDVLMAMNPAALKVNLRRSAPRRPDHRRYRRLRRTQPAQGGLDVQSAGGRERSRRSGGGARYHAADA